MSLLTNGHRNLWVSPIPITPEEQSDLVSAPVVSGANGPRPKLVNTGKQVLNLAATTSRVLLATKLSQFARLKPSRNMVSAAVAPLDSTVLLVRFWPVLMPS